VGLFQFPVRIVDSSDNVVETVHAWVDTASTYTWLPRAVFERLGVVPRRTQTFVLADGRRERKAIAQVRILLSDEPFLTCCAVAEEGEEPLLGAVALEEAGLAADPVYKRLVPADAYALIALVTNNS
jgi:predicted aspartyl protease